MIVDLFAEKPCRKCGVHKRLNEFPREPRNRDGRSGPALASRAAHYLRWWSR